MVVYGGVAGFLIQMGGCDSKSFILRPEVFNMTKRRSRILLLAALIAVVPLDAAPNRQSIDTEAR